MRPIFAIGLVALSAGCNQAPSQSSGNETPTKTVDGYGDLKFGMSFQDALTATRADLYSPLSLKSCFNQLAIRGCFLHPRDNLTPYRSVDGIPYTLGLSFNRFDKLTDISLNFERDTSEDPDQKVSRSDCISIHDRTLDWLNGEYGPFDNREVKGGNLAKTEKGHPYMVTSNEPKSFFGEASKALPNGRTIYIFSYYLNIGGDHDCQIGVEFREPQSVERWELSPDEKADMEKMSNNIG